MKVIGQTVLDINESHWPAVLDMNESDWAINGSGYK